MLVGLILSSAVASSVSWAPSGAFALTCTGTSTAYQEGVAIKQTIPWQETFKVDLSKGTYCAQSCGRKFQLSAVRQDELDLENSTATSSSSIKRYHPSSGAIEISIVMGASPLDRLHIEQAGVCKMVAKPSK